MKTIRFFEFYRENKKLISIEVWSDDENGKEKEALTEVGNKDEVFKINLKYTVVSSKAMKLKVMYERNEIKLTEAEKKEIEEREDEVKKQIGIWMEENFK